MAIVRKSLDEILTEKPRIDRVRLDATTEEDLRHHAIEDGEDPNAPMAQFHLVIPVQAVRQRLGMTQEAFGELLKIPIGTIRNWEQNRVPPDPAARALLTILYRQPEAALRALKAA